MAASNIQYEIADRTRTINAGGIGAAHLLVKRLGLDQAINERLDLLKVHLPYHESDHILNIAYNLLAGNTRLEHLELLRNDEAYLDALGASRIPDPTTAGDFCRRFDEQRIDALQEVINEARIKVWPKACSSCSGCPPCGISTSMPRICRETRGKSWCGLPSTRSRPSLSLGSGRRTPSSR
jgi:hypothetical protein